MDVSALQNNSNHMNLLFEQNQIVRALVIELVELTSAVLENEQTRDFGNDIIQLSSDEDTRDFGNDIIQLSSDEDTRNSEENREKLSSDDKPVYNHRLLCNNCQKPYEKNLEIFADDLPSRMQVIYRFFSNPCNCTGPTVWIKIEDIDVLFHDLETLKSGHLLNDVIMNSYMRLINQRSAEKKKIPYTHCFDTYLYESLKTGQDRPMRWLKDVHLFDFNYLFFPLHLNQNHWALCVVDNVDKRIEYYDSYGIVEPECLDLILKFIQSQAMARKLIISEYSLFINENMPKQTNKIDCGVFVLAFAEKLSRGSCTTFAQVDIQEFRIRIMSEILDKKFYVREESQF